MGFAIDQLQDPAVNLTLGTYLLCVSGSLRLADGFGAGTGRFPNMKDLSQTWCQN